jgi:hypothetical protein
MIESTGLEESSAAISVKIRKVAVVGVNRNLDDEHFSQGHFQASSCQSLSSVTSVDYVARRGRLFVASFGALNL